MSGAESQGAAGGEGGDSAAPSADMQRYYSAVMSMNRCVKILDRPESPHVIRQGINTALRDMGSVVGLLMAKGVITAEEYQRALADGMEREVCDYAVLIAQKFPDFDVRVTGGQVTLAPRKAGAAEDEGGAQAVKP